MKAFNFCLGGRGSKTGQNPDATPGAQLDQKKAFMAPQGSHAENASYEGPEGEFRCKSCLRGPPLTKKYAKNQCQTCYKKEKKIQKEGLYS